MLASLRRLLKSILLLFCILRTTAQRAPLSVEERQMFSQNGDDYYGGGGDDLWALFRHLPQQQQQQQQQQHQYHQHHHERAFVDERRTGSGNAEIVLESANVQAMHPHQQATRNDEFDTAAAAAAAAQAAAATATTTNLLSFPLRMEVEERGGQGDGDSGVGRDNVNEPIDVADGKRLRSWTTDIGYGDDEQQQFRTKGRTVERMGAPLRFPYAYKHLGKSQPTPWTWPNARYNGDNTIAEQLDKMMPVIYMDGRKQLGSYIKDMNDYKLTLDQLNLLDDNNHPYAKHKRQNVKDKTDRLMPLLTAEALKRLGFYFKDLKDSTHYAHNYKLTQDQLRLLDGDHPLHMLQVNSAEMDPQDVSAFLQALRTYQPSHKVRSLVSMTPNGYQGSHLIDPNYMWIGLGK